MANEDEKIKPAKPEKGLEQFAENLEQSAVATEQARKEVEAATLLAVAGEAGVAQPEEDKLKWTPCPKFLHDKYRDLSSSQGVQDILDLANPDESIPLDRPEARIQNYLGFLKDLIDRPDPQERERGVDAIKQFLYARYIIKPEQIPESYFESKMRRRSEEGRDSIKSIADQRAGLTESVIEDQKQSLDQWVDYLASSDAKYPDYLKYWVARSILKMGKYNKEKKKFVDRKGRTVSPFPELNREALALVLNAMERKFAGKQPVFGYDILEEAKQQFIAMLDKENFAQLYGLAIEEFKPISEELLKITEGKWVQYRAGSDPQKLVDSLAPYGTGWCIRGPSTARIYLYKEGEESGESLEVYYSNDQEGKPVVPRVVIVRDDKHISQVRGVAEREEIDRYIGDVIQAKLVELPGGQVYVKTARDAKKLTELQQKVRVGEQLIKNDLIFLYEIEEPIRNFGYKDKEPRIAEIRATRDPKADAPIVFECAPDEIAWSREEIDERTRAYVGPLFPGIFEQLKHLEHIYTEFPGERISRRSIEIGGKTKEELEKELEAKGCRIDHRARSLMESKEFSPQKKIEQVDLVCLKALSLGLPLGWPSGATYEQICKKAEELGLELCPAEVGPHYMLAYADKPSHEDLEIAMEPISIRDVGPNTRDDCRDQPRIFGIRSRKIGKRSLHLRSELMKHGEPVTFVSQRDEFVFRYRPRRSGDAEVVEKDA